MPETYLGPGKHLEISSSNEDFQKNIVVFFYFFLATMNATPWTGALDS